MPFERVRADDDAALATLFDLQRAAVAVDDPQAPPDTVDSLRDDIAYGWDGHPSERYLYRAENGEAFGYLAVDLPVHDNLDLVGGDLVVHPDHRRRGHGSAMMAELLRRAEQEGRHLVWVGSVEDEPAAVAFATKHGFSQASHDARRYQVLADVDWPAVDALYESSLGKAEGYRFERIEPPISDELLTELVDVTAAINDAPMGDLTFEPEVFDLARLRQGEDARTRRGWHVYRIAARELATGEIGGHTFVVVDPDVPEWGHQADTAVAKAHRGHRLGLLLKVDMMRWLAETEPRLRTIQTWNNADNTFMISVNESIGYRLSNTFGMYQRALSF